MTDEELKEHFDEKCMRYASYEFYDIDEAYDHVNDYVGTFGTFKWGYELAQETIEKQKKEIEEQTKIIISNGESLIEYEAEIKAKNVEIENLESELGRVFIQLKGTAQKFVDNDKAIAEAREVIDLLNTTFKPVSDVLGKIDALEQAKVWLENNKE